VYDCVHRRRDDWPDTRDAGQPPGIAISPYSGDDIPLKLLDPIRQPSDLGGDFAENYSGD
jgi:hypothetical protein